MKEEATLEPEKPQSPDIQNAALGGMGSAGMGSAGMVLAGPLDQYAADTLKTQLLPLVEGTGDAVFDFRNIDRMHTASLQVLIALQKDLEPTGRKVVLQSVEPGLRKLMHISGTEHFFHFSDGSH